MSDMFDKVYSLYKVTQFPKHIECLKAGWTVPPIHLNMDLSSHCSQSCQFCFRNNLSLGGIDRFKDNDVFISKDTLSRLINEIPDVGICGVELTGFYGEPTMNPNFDFFASGLKSAGIQVGLITNGDFLHKIKSYSILSYIRVSISSLNNEIHKKIRGGKRDINKILESLEKINSERQSGVGPVTGFGFTIDLYNYKEVYDVCMKACNIGCNNIRLTPVWKNDMSYYSEIVEAVTTQVKKAKKEIGSRMKIIGPDTYEKVYMGKKNYNRCCYSNLTMNITADGECYPCCVTRGVKGWSFGNINEQSLDEIVWGYPRRKLLKNINPNGCPSCIWDAKNEFIEYMVEGGMHAEFV